MKEMIFKRNCENNQINLVLWLSFSVFLNVAFVYVVVWPEQILSKKIYHRARVYTRTTEWEVAALIDQAAYCKNFVTYPALLELNLLIVWLPHHQPQICKDLICYIFVNIIANRICTKTCKTLRWSWLPLAMHFKNILVLMYMYTKQPFYSQKKYWHHIPY